MSILEAFLAGKEARRVADAQEQINAMQSFIGQNGQAIMAGDQNALGQLAGFGPQGLGMAMDVQGNVQQRERQTKMDARADREFDLRLKEHAASLTAEQRAAEAAKIDEVLAGASHFYNKGDEAGYANWLKSKGLDPAQYAFADFPAHAVTGEKALAALKATEAPAGPEWRAATPEEAAARGATAGQINDKTGEFKKTSVDSTMMLETLPNGTTRFIQGPGAGAEGNKMKPSDPNAMIASIDGILNDPALPYSTGALSVLQHIPGTPMKRFQGRAKQLEGQAFLQAFESLKGAGQITEIEGDKATKAIGRLDTAQDAKDYAQALIELREVLELAASRPPGWAATQEAAGDAIFRQEVGAPPPATDKPLQLSPEALKWLEE